MRHDQLAYAVIFLVPMIVLNLDWFVNTTWTGRLLKLTVWPWALFTIGWMIWTKDWNGTPFLLFFGLGFAVQQRLKGLYGK